jgi:ribosomal protein S18 acetylase RimI-like enzyme
MENSLDGLIADRVFVYREAGVIKGMVTCKITGPTAGQQEGEEGGPGDRQAGRVGSIGLIATGAAHQGKGIGRSLLRATDHYYRANGVETSTVVTQKTNIQACLFYEKEGFTEYKRQFVYHLWLN